jgi:DNA polymerase-3 subunit epsilon
MRQIVLDTETTGLDPEQGHRIIEIGCVEMLNRRPSGNNYHQYLQPDREIDEGALEVHGITQEFLADKPRFADLVHDLLEYLKGAELIIHNAPFDVGFLNHELGLVDGTFGRVEEYCGVIDTLKLARSLHPGQKNSLDALCKRYSIDNSQRTLHGALLDAEILADVYLAMTGGQVTLFAEGGDPGQADAGVATQVRRVDPDRARLPVIRASGEELQAHEQWLAELDRAVGGSCVWRQLQEEPGS